MTYFMEYPLFQAPGCTVYIVPQFICDSFDSIFKAKSDLLLPFLSLYNDL